MVREFCDHCGKEIVQARKSDGTYDVCISDVAVWERRAGNAGRSVRRTFCLDCLVVFLTTQDNLARD